MKRKLLTGIVALTMFAAVSQAQDVKKEEAKEGRGGKEGKE